MKKKLRWITETAVMLALLVAVQALTKPFGQLVTGSCVNAVLAVTVLIAGLYSGLTVALFSPLLAFVLGIAGNPLTIPAIMVGNSIYVILLYSISDKKRKPLVLHILHQVLAWITASTAKFAAMYAIVVWLICGVFKPQLAGSPLVASFSWPQLFAALIGGAVALLIAPVLRKALKK